MELHPLEGISINIRSLKCFSSEGSGLFHFSPISFIIGRNNSGKSAVIDALQALIGKSAPSFSDYGSVDGLTRIEFSSAINDSDLRRYFSASTSGGHIPGNHWRFAEQNLQGRSFIWSLPPSGSAEFHDQNADWEKLQTALPTINQVAPAPFSKLNLLRINAERDVVPEGAHTDYSISGSGAGLTNTIQAFINNKELPSNLVEEVLLKDLNDVYKGDSYFSRILCQYDQSAMAWEIYLRENGKGDIPLSQSGSSLKTIFIILCYLRLIPEMMTKYSDARTVLAIEEPENNLHPALLRRLLEFIAAERRMRGFSLIISTHSPICVDWAAMREDATVLHVRRDGTGNTQCRNVLDHVGRTGILDDLDVRGSDILQSNGIVWVEGPSDRIYIKKWIDIYSGGSLVEGAHYNFMYYGGKILSHFDALPPSEVTDRIRILSINRNAALIMDSDRRPAAEGSRKPRRNLNETKLRIIEEIESCGGICWVTAGKEIENYIPDNVWRSISGAALQALSPYDDIPNIVHIKSKWKTKVDLAHAAVAMLDDKCHLDKLDLLQCIDSLTKRISLWNKLN